MHLIDQFRHRAKRGDYQRHLVFDTQRQLFLDDPVGAMDNQIDPERRSRLTCFILDRGQPVTNGDQPVLKSFKRALVLGRKGAHDAGAATGKNKIRARCQKHRRGNNGKRQAGLKLGRKGHLFPLEYMIISTQTLGGFLCACLFVCSFGVYRVKRQWQNAGAYAAIDAALDAVMHAVRPSAVTAGRRSLDSHC